MARREIRKVEFGPARRKGVPLIVGLFGPSGCGKTYTALELATGIAEVYDGPIAFIDTENGRGSHYADRFTYQVSEMGEPFGALDYLDYLRAAQQIKPAVTIVDSMSHEHEGPGGLLDLHEQECDRMAGNDWQKRERVKMLAWQEPKRRRRQLINGILRMPGNFIFCFRAKESSKPVKGKDGKTEVVQLGFVPIAGDEFVFEATLCAFLPPAARGVPDWNPANPGERQMVKLPVQFARLAQREGPLDRTVGRRLAEWAKGGAGDTSAGSVRGDREGRQVAAGSGRTPSAVQGSSDAAPRGRAPEPSAPAPTSADEYHDPGPCWLPIGDSRCGLEADHEPPCKPEEEC